MRLGSRLGGLVMLVASAFLQSPEGRAEGLAPLRPTPLLGAVLATPRPVPGSDGREHIVYEIRITNVTGGKATVENVDVLDAASGQAVARLDKAAVSARLTLGGHRGAESNDIGAYQVAVLFMHVALAEGTRVPDRITHEVRAAFEASGGELSVRIAPTLIDRAPLPRLAPPLAGKDFVAADGCCDSTRHVRALLPINGEWRLSQRFAIDWEQIDAQNRIVVGDLKDPRSYRIFGETVLAVADGTVVASRNDLPEQVPGTFPANLPIDEADGNFVVLDIGGGSFVLYAHMQPGSVRVRAGDAVRRGDRLGLVGNTGNSVAPHLHLHVMDGPSPLDANGIPYVFDAFTVTAVDEAGTADFDRAEGTGSPMTLTPRVPPERQRNVLPMDQSVVDWGP
jgi:Peptidase family M23